MKDSGLYEVQITFLTAFPGTPLYERLKRDGRILRDKAWELCTLFDINFTPKNMSVADLQAGFLGLAKRLYSFEETSERRRKFKRMLKSSPHFGPRAHNATTLLTVPLPATMVPIKNGWAKIYRRAVIRRPVIARRAVVGRRRRVGRRGLVHVEVYSPRDIILRREQVPSPEHGGLDKLISMKRERLDDVVIGPEIMKRSIAIAPNLQGQRRHADILAIGLDFHTGFRSLD